MDPKPPPKVSQLTGEEEEEEEEEEVLKKSSNRSVCYLFFVLLFGFFSFALLFSLLAFFFLFSSGVLSVLIDSFSSIPNPISVASQCRILSAGVDLRSSKVCELGLLNYKAKHVFDPYDRTRFRCRYDYYWASVFKVEYKEHSSGQTRSALVESPKEALPLDCRPSFGTAWLNKDKLKVNETYNCWYTPGISNVDIFPDNIYKCQAKYPSMAEMIERFSVLLMKITKSLFSSKGRTKRVIQESVIGVITGMSTSLISIIMLKVLQRSLPRLVKIWYARNLHLAAYGGYFKRICFLVVYFSVVGWLIFQYGKMLGLPDLFISS